MARYIDADALYEKLYPLDLVDKRLYTINAKAVADAIAKTPTADVAPKSEVATKICNEINEEIVGALTSNYRVIRDALEYDELYYTACGKISALRGILDFIAELKKKYTEEKE